MQEKPKKHHQVCMVLSNKKIAPEHYLMTIQSKKMAKAATPGQFVSILCNIKGKYFDYGPLLRRPMSIHNANKKKGTLQILYRVVGPGTEILSLKKKGYMLDVLGPLGNGFTIDENSDYCALVGGGTGISPLYFLAKELKRKKKKIYVFLGAKTKEFLLAREKFRGLGFVDIATDDGTEGYKGPITDVLENYCKNISFGQIFLAGPKQMYKEASKFIDIPTQATLEQVMACGIGACLGCATKIKADNKVGYEYKKVCKDGPVFDLEKIVFD